MKLHFACLAWFLLCHAAAFSQPAGMPKLAAEQNAATYFRQAGQIIDKMYATEPWRSVWMEGIDKVSPELADRFAREMQPVITLVEQGTNRTQVDWELPPTFMLLAPIPHLPQQFHLLSGLAYHSEVMCRQKQFAQARKDWILGLRVAQHLGQLDTQTPGPLLLASIANSYRDIAYRRIQANLSQLPLAELELLEKELKELPPPPPMRQVYASQLQCDLVMVQHWVDHPIPADMDKEQRKWMEAWKEAAAQPKVLDQLKEDLRGFMEQAGKISALPWPQCMDDLEARSRQFKRHRHKKCLLPLIGSCLSPLSSAYFHQTNRAMVQAGIAYRLRGQSGFASVADPTADGTPFTAVDTDSGMEIQSHYPDLAHKGKYVTLLIPDLKYEP